MSTAQPDFGQLKERMRATWMSGDFGKIAEFAAAQAADFVSRIGIQPGMKALDVACGTGNLAIPAARLGAKVTGVDIAPNLLEQARQRAAAEKLDARFDEGDAERLPYSEGAFDIAMSMFGAMFAPRPELVAAELLRVCRPGGTIAMANWTREGFVGRMFATAGRHAPPPPGIPAPVLWGDEAVVRERLGGGCSEIKLARVEMEFDFPFAPKDVVNFFREFFGPTKAAFARLDAQGQAALAADLEALWKENNRATGDLTHVRAEYLEVIAARA